MADEKKTRRSKTTPAIDAGPGVTEDILDPAFFTIGVEADRLPPIGSDNWIGRLADVAYHSGYFQATPAQLAIRILAGDALNLRPAESLFDLTVSAEGSIAWRGAGNFSTTSDQIGLDRINAAAGDALEGNAVKDVADRKLKEITNGYDGPAGSVVDIATGKPAVLQNRESVASVIEKIKENPDATNFYKKTGPEPRKVENAIPDPPPSAKELPLPTVAESGKEDARPQSGEKAAQFEPIPEHNSGSELRNAVPATLAAAADGLEVGATISNWRLKIESNLRDLGFNDGKVADKVSEFDSKNSLQKKAMFEQSEMLYKERTETKRSEVLAALTADGKPDNESRIGFFLYAEVPDDPATWTYNDAIRAWLSLDMRKPADPAAT